jgi:2,4-dienoyl-CoA reductase (NADPH2)
VLERSNRATLESRAFNRHWGISEDASVPGGLAPEGMEKPHEKIRITLLKRSTTPFGSTLGRTTGWVHRAELARHGVAMIRGVQYRGIDDTGVHFAVEGKEQVVPADTVVICAGQTSLVPFSMNEKNFHLIGGAKAASELDAKRAMLEGAELAAAL